MKALVGTKLGMTTVIQENGSSQAVTVIHAGPMTATQVKTVDSDGYNAVQLGYSLAKNPAKPQVGHTKTLNMTPKVLKEFKTSEEIAVGDSFSVSVFEVGDAVKVSGLTKGKGFAGTIKRHNFSRGPKTHGSRNYRKPGSIGSMYPQKIFKGKRMAGRMGYENASVLNVKVAFVDAEQNLIGLIGAVPGPKKGIVTVEGL